MLTYKDNSRQIISMLLQAIDEGVTETAQAIAEEAARLAPKKTGELAGSYKAEKLGFAEAQAGSDLKRAVFSEFGTHQKAGRFTLLQATVKAEKLLPQKIKGKIK